MEAEPNGEPTRVPIIMLMSACKHCDNPIALVEGKGAWVHMLTQKPECAE